MIYLSARLESTRFRSVYLKRSLCVIEWRDAFGRKDDVHSYSYGRSYEGIRKYPRKLGSLQRAESVADRGRRREDRTQFDIWL